MLIGLFKETLKTCIILFAIIYSVWYFRDDIKKGLIYLGLKEKEKEKK